MNRKSFLASLAALVAAPFLKKKESTEEWIVPNDPNWKEAVRKEYAANRLGKTKLVICRTYNLMECGRIREDGTLHTGDA